MDIREEFVRRMEEILVFTDPDEYPQFTDYLAFLINDEDADCSPMALMSTLSHFNAVPQNMWDYVIEALEQEAEEGNADAMNDLGAMYYDGTGCVQSFEKALHYYHLAAENGCAIAQENLGYCYYYGRDTAVDYKKAFHYYALGAFTGSLVSLYKIGDMYANGYYVEKNEKEAFMIYNRCMNLMTDEDAPRAAGPVYLRLGKAFLYGRGVDENPSAALACLQSAELHLIDMVKDGDVMYKKSLNDVIALQQKARNNIMKTLPEREWEFD